MIKAQRSKSIRKELLVWVLVVLFFLFVVRMALGYFQIDKIANRVFDEELMDTADSVAARLDFNHPKVRLEIPPEALSIFTHYNRDKLYYQVFDDQGKWIIGNIHITLPVEKLQFGSCLTLQIFGQEMRVTKMKITLPEMNKTVSVVAAETTNARRDFMTENLIPIVVGQVFVALFSASMMWFLVSKAFQPFSILAGSISSRANYDLSELEEADAPHEVQPLMHAFNTMCRRVSETLEVRERFIANAAHQLRTPVAALKTYSSYGCGLDDAGELNRIVSKIDSALDVLTHLINQLLVLVRVQDDSVMTRFELLNLNDVVADMVSLLTVAVYNKKQDLHFDPSADAADIFGDLNSVQQLTANLIENAIQYSAENGKISVWVSAGSDNVILAVEDEGPGIPEEERANVFERFYRIQGVGGKGSGLGLSIVKEVTRTHNARVNVDSGSNGIGTKVTVAFPRYKGL